MKTGSRNPIRIIVALALCAFVLVIAANLNVSNIGAYDMYIRNNINSIGDTTIGNTRAIRSDEWLVSSAATFYELKHPEEISSLPDLVVKCVDINFWTNKILSSSRVFAYRSLWGYLLLLISALFFFYIFEKKNWKFILMMAIVITMQPGISWWNSPGLYAVFFSIVDLFYYFFHNKEVWKKLLCCVGLVVCVGYYIVNAYPAWQIPLAYYAVLLLIAVFSEKKETIKKSDIPYIAITVGLMISIAACYLISKSDYITAILNTEYPGKRTSSGGNTSYDYIIHYLLMPLASIKEVTFIETSEASTFYSMFPIPFILYFAYRKILGRKKIISLSLIFSVVCYIYSFIGFPSWLSNVTLWSMTTSYRVCIIADMSMLISLIFELYYISQEKGKDRPNTRTIIICNAVEIIFLTTVLILASETIEYMGVAIFIVIAIFLLIFLNAILFRLNKTAVILLLAVSVLSTAFINPVNIGTGIIEETPLAKKISRLEDEDSGNWITNDDWVISKYVKAQGAKCLNALNYPPDIELYGKYDENGENSKVYNRYSHVVLHIGEQAVNYNLIVADRFEMQINSDVLKEWNVKYIISKDAIDYSNEILQINKIYSDMDGYDIYKVKYN